MNITSKNILVSFILVFFAIQSQAQKKLFLGANTFAAYNFWGPEQSYPYEPRWGYGAGLEAMYFFHPRVFGGLGLSYIRRNYALKNIPDTRNIFVGGNSPGQDNVTHYDLTHQLDYWALPLVLGYEVFNVKEHDLSFFLVGGFRLNYLFRERVVYHFEEGDQGYIQPLSDPDQRLSYSLTIGPAMTYQPLPRVFVFAKPEYTYDFYTPDSRRIKFHSLGLSLSIQYQLSK